ncbi:MAG: prepilin peptidase [Firmicutes bacterium]|nr:prepilin peptidase [Bacillota bacterium]
MSLFIFILFISIGSFLNVCIHRIPRNESIVYPPSHCPKCDTKLKFIDLIPIISYLSTKGKCRYCGESISPQYPIIELLTAIISILIYLKYGLSILFVKYVVLSMILIVVSVIDYKYQIIPNKIIIFGFTVGISLHLLYNVRTSFINGTIGLLIGGGIFLLIAIVTKGAMGGGDIKLMGMIGFYLGYKSILLITFLSFIIGAFISILLLVTKIKSRKDFIPFGPFISIATIIVILYGKDLVGLYLKLILN